MKLLDSIKDITSIKANKDGIYFCSNNKLFDSKNNLLFENVENQSFWYDKNYIFYHNLEGIFNLYSISDKNSNVIEFAPMLNNSNEVFVSYDHKFCTQDFKSYFKNALYDLKSNKFLIKYIKYEDINNERILFNTNEILICITLNFIIKAYSLPEAKPLWQFNIEDLGKYLDRDGNMQTYQVDKFIGVCKESLLVACTGQLIIDIDIHTGKLNRKWQELQGFGNAAYQGRLQHKLPSTSGFQLDISESYLYINGFIGLKI